MSDGTSKRRLKIYYGFHSNSDKQRPVIRLCGDYLSKMDFNIGDMVEITVNKECITITKTKPN